MDQFDTLESPDDFFFQLSAEDFKTYRIEYNKTQSSVPQPRDKSLRGCFASSNTTPTPIQQNVTQRP